MTIVTIKDGVVKTLVLLAMLGMPAISTNAEEPTGEDPLYTETKPLDSESLSEEPTPTTEPGVTGGEDGVDDLFLFDPSKVELPETIEKWINLPPNSKQKVPEMKVQAINYSTVAENSSVRINNQDYREGAMINGEVKLIRIEQRRLIMEVDGIVFSRGVIGNGF